MGRSPRLSRERVIVVGAGRAGVAAASELRQSGYRGEVVIISDEPDPPYFRPACSKGLLFGKQRPADIALDLRGCEDVQWRLGQRVASLDSVGRVLETDANESLAYDGLVIATGARTVMPANTRRGQPGLHVYDTLAESWALRRNLRDANRVAIVGAGLSGCETASAVRAQAREAILIDSNRLVMRRAVGSVAGRLITDQLRREGVDLLLGRRLAQAHRLRRGGWWLGLDNGDEVEVDLVVIATGERADTSWLEGSPGIDVTDGVLCDESLRVKGAEGIVAAGAVARWPNARLGPAPRRVGQWISALQQGRAAARALLAGDEPVPAVAPLNRFWSDQFGLQIHVSGDIEGADSEVRLTPMRPGRRDVARAGLLVSYLRHGQLVGVVGVNAQLAFTKLTRMLLHRPQPLAMARSGQINLAAVDQEHTVREIVANGRSTGRHSRQHDELQPVAARSSRSRHALDLPPQHPLESRPENEYADDRERVVEQRPGRVAQPRRERVVESQPAVRRPAASAYRPGGSQPGQQRLDRQPDVVWRNNATRPTDTQSSPAHAYEPPAASRQPDVILRQNTNRLRIRDLRPEHPSDYYQDDEGEPGSSIDDAAQSSGTRRPPDGESERWAYF
jgi:NADPH-dependent 2,4-dienoyl-CoA reductase/sulfur reductase-like enzyme